MSNPNDREYTNGEITVFWKPARCIHATTCFRELIEVYNPRKRPWVNMNGASTERIIEVTNKCPTQAIYWKYNKDLKNPPKQTDNDTSGEEETPETLHRKKEDAVKPVSIQAMKDGPFLIEGEFTIIGPEGNKLKPTPLTSFCRCGNSKSQPFCDGTHRSAGFKDK